MKPRDRRQADDLGADGAHRDDGAGPAAPTRALVILPERRHPAEPGGVPARSAEEQLVEAVSLARAIGLEVTATLIAPLRKPVPATLLGSGKVEEIAALVRVNDAELVIIDHPLSPVQQRNLEKAWSAKVLDRTGLILEIFGDRAQTNEGRLQVELAHLNYQKSRLVRSWTHLERQRGGYGFLGGPGETQIEADRRQIQTRIRKIEDQLDRVRNMRSVHRAERKRVPRPVAALVGYTNAGKSTLFNKLTGAELLAEDMVFATLDPTLRRVRLPHGEELILSDTVGFISELPTALVAAFRATLEEVLEADIILHVRDIASPETAQQAEDVMHVLAELGIHPGQDRRTIEVWNKIDRLEPAQCEALQSKAAAAEPPAVMISAVTGEGVDDLLKRIERALMGERPTVIVEFGPQQLAAASWLYEHTEILERNDDPETGSARIKVRIAEPRMTPFQEWAQRERVTVAATENSGALT
ncbi:MAG: GTPase HflX [Rhizobiales bacterium]|nr:GTPase HflX [Hyphomicrobiales bacterium]